MRSFNHRAGNTGTGVTGGVSLMVVLTSMDHQRGSFAAQQAIGLALFKRDESVERVRSQFARGGNVNVGHVASVRTILGHQTMFAVVGIEVASRTFEWRFAFSCFVNVKTVFAFRKTL